MKPKHYVDGDLEPLKIIQEHNLPFELGNALKYIARCNHKGTKREDLEKAIDYLERYGKRQPKLLRKLQFQEEWSISEDLAYACLSIIENDHQFAIHCIKYELNNE